MAHFFIILIKLLVKKKECTGSITIDYKMTVESKIEDISGKLSFSDCAFDISFELNLKEGGSEVAQ